MPVAAHSRTPAPEKRYPWPTVVVALLILGQIAGMAALLYLQIVVQEQVAFARLTLKALVDSLLGLLFFALATLAIVISGVFAVVSALRRWKSSWSNAMFVQMLILVIGLVLYSGERRPWYAYAVLAAGVIAVTYLMLPGVQAAFLPPPEVHHE